MDRTDVALVQMLLADSRLPYRELAERLDLSVNAVHKRIQGLIDDGVIRRFTAKASQAALGMVTVIVHGVGQARSEESIARLSTDDRVFWVAKASAGLLYVGGYLHDLGELEGFVQHVKGAASMLDPQVGIIATPPADGRDRRLTVLDYRILDHIAADSRQPVAGIAEALEVSAKTVRRRLARMSEEGLVEFSLDWSPDRSNDIIALFHLRVDGTTDRYRLALELMSRYPQRVLFFFLFSNRPEEIILTTWSANMMELSDLSQRLEREVVRAVPNILYGGEVFETWRERVVHRRARPASSKREERSPSG